MSDRIESSILAVSDYDTYAVVSFRRDLYIDVVFISTISTIRMPAIGSAHGTDRQLQLLLEAQSRAYTA